MCLGFEFRDRLGMACVRFQAKSELALIPKLMEVYKGRRALAMNFQEHEAKEGKPTKGEWHGRAYRHGQTVPMFWFGKSVSFYLHGGRCLNVWLGIRLKEIA